MAIILLILLSLLVLVFCVVSVGGLLIFSNHRLYCYIFEHEMYKLWEYYLNNVDAIIPDPEYNWYDNNPSVNIYHTKQFITHDNKRLTYWGDADNVSIHEKNCDCVLSTFDKYHNKLMVKALKERGLI